MINTKKNHPLDSAGASSQCTIFLGIDHLFTCLGEISHNMGFKPESYLLEIEAVWSINCKTTLPWLVRGEFGSNTPTLPQSIESYSPLLCVRFYTTVKI